MKSFYTPDHKLHASAGELMFGDYVPAFEKPERAELIRARIEEVGLGPILPPGSFPREALLRVHDSGMIAFLETGYAEWLAAGRTGDALAFSWRARGMRDDIVPSFVDGKLSYYSFDSGAPLTATSWAAIKSSADVALTAADAIRSGERAAFALCRPAGPPCAEQPVWRLLLPQQCGDRRAVAAGCGRRPSSLSWMSIIITATAPKRFSGHDRTCCSSRSMVIQTSNIRSCRVIMMKSVQGPVKAAISISRCPPAPIGMGGVRRLNWPVGGSSFMDRIFLSFHSALTPTSRTRFHNSSSTIRLSEMGERIAKLRRPTLFVMEGGYAVAEIGINAVNVLQGFEG